MFVVQSFAQHDDYIGAGNISGIIITSSSDDSSAINTVNGSGLIAEYTEASRFLAQASMGATMEEIALVTEIGIEAWIENQFNIDQSFVLDEMRIIWDELLQAYEDYGLEEDEIFGPWGLHFNYAWSQRTMTKEDQLRQRIAYALSQILVISMDSELMDYGEGLSSYYDLLGKHAFGNYRDLLLEVTLHPCMGFYLSHLNNPRAIPEENIHPDENYAREIMQLFSIGLYELNIDGTRKKDANGNDIPTYNNNDIKELAKVFTGLGVGGLQDFVDWSDEPYFGLGIWGGDRTVPMMMFDEFHEQEEKTLIQGVVLPANQSGMQDVEDAIDMLFNHPNVGPFISRQLIQRLIKSNPSKEYVARVANTFNNDGNGERGNMKAVIRSILLDAEARSCEDMLDPKNGKLREPLLKKLQFLKSISLDSPLGRYWDNYFNHYEETGQTPLFSPTVFNFYLPDYSPVGEIADAGLVAPEFNLHNTKTSIGYINAIHSWLFWDAPMFSWEQDFGDLEVNIDYDYFEEIINDPEAIINYFDIVLSNGQLTDDVRNIIRENIADISLYNSENYIRRLQLIIYIIMASPDFNISK